MSHGRPYVEKGVFPRPLKGSIQEPFNLIGTICFVHLIHGGHRLGCRGKQWPTDVRRAGPLCEPPFYGSDSFGLVRVGCGEEDAVGSFKRSRNRY